MNNRALQWVISNDTSVSSKVIWAVCMGIKPGETGIPLDKYDFGKCYRLVKFVVPGWEGRLQDLARKQPDWSPIVSHWEILCRAYNKLSNEDFDTILSDITKYR